MAASGIDVDDVIASLAGNRDSPKAAAIGLECGVRPVEPSQSAAIELDDCPVCGSHTVRPTFAIDGLPYRLMTCSECGTGRLSPRPSADEIRGFYPPEYYGVTGSKFEPVVERLVRLVGSRHAQSMTRGLGRGARVLDVGCGRGVLLSALADRGLEVHGFEINPTAADGADPRAEIRIADELAGAGYPANHFDQVILWHVLEHLPNPRETLLEIRRILRPGGRLVVAVPNFGSLQARWAGPGWFHLDLPRHLFHFPLSGLRRLLDGCGFDCRSEHHFSLRQNPFGWVQSALNHSSGLPRNGLYSLLKRRQNGGFGLHLQDFQSTEKETPDHPPGGAPACERIRLSGGHAGERHLTGGLRFRLRLAYWLGMPVGLVLSVLATILRSGASVSVVAIARDGDALPSVESNKLDEIADAHPECVAPAGQHRRNLD